MGAVRRAHTLCYVADKSHAVFRQNGSAKTFRTEWIEHHEFTRISGKTAVCSVWHAGTNRLRLYHTA
jgi:hypothetical protein